MQKAISKRVFLDGLRRTRIVRLVTIPVAVLFGYIGMTENFINSAAIPQQTPMYMSAIGMLIMLLIGEMTMTGWRRRRRYEFFQTIPASRKEWFWSVFLAETVNLFVYAFLAELSVMILFRKRMSLVLYVYEAQNSEGYSGGPFFADSLHRLALLMIIGIVFVSVISVVRELTHSNLAFLMLLFGTAAGYWISFALVPSAIRSFSGNLVSPRRSLVFRLRIFYRLFGLLRPESLSVAYDYVALLVNLLFAAGILYLGSRLSKKSAAEYIGAEYRNKRLFRILLVVLNLLPLLMVVYSYVIGGESSPNVILVPALLLLIIYFLCRLFREKFAPKYLKYVLVAILLAAAIPGGSLLYAKAAMKLPERKDAILVYFGTGYDCFLYSERTIDRIYSVLDEDIKHPKTERFAGEETTVTIYTATGCREYYIDMKSLQGIWEDSVGVVFCDAGRKTEFLTPFASSEEYEKFLSLIPEEDKKAIPVYYRNALGGITKSKEKVVIGAADREKACVTINVIDAHGMTDQQALGHRISTGSEAMAYYYEKLCRPQKEQLAEFFGRDTRERAFFIRVIRLTDEETAREESPRTYYFNLRTRGGEAAATTGIDSYTAGPLTKEQTDLLIGAIFQKGDRIDFQKEISNIRVEYSEQTEEEMLWEGGTCWFYINTEELKPLLDAVDEARAKANADSAHSGEETDE